MQSRQEHKTATLDMDATLVETGKESALYCYEHFKAYQPLNVRLFKRFKLSYNRENFAEIRKNTPFKVMYW